MIENIRFCYCSRLDLDEEKANQCMYFGFTERARKVLSDEFLFEITDTTTEENMKKAGIPLFDKELKNGNKVFIVNLDDNKYRIPTKYIEPFIRCLFKYLPAYYISPEDQNNEYICDLSGKENEL